MMTNRHRFCFVSRLAVLLLAASATTNATTLVRMSSPKMSQNSPDDCAPAVC